MLMKRDEGGEIRPSREELEGMSFDDLSAWLVDGTITRSRAIKLAGAALLGGALTVLWPGEADAANRRRRRRRRIRRRRRKRQAAVVATPNQVNITVPGEPGLENVTVTNNGPDTVVIEPQLVDAEGFTLDLSGLDLADLTLEAGESVDIPVLVSDVNLLGDGEGLLEIRDASTSGIFEDLLLEVVELDATDLLTGLLD
jgi:hypothetical protein